MSQQSFFISVVGHLVWFYLLNDEINAGEFMSNGRSLVLKVGLND